MNQAQVCQQINKVNNSAAISEQTTLSYLLCRLQSC